MPITFVLRDFHLLSLKRITILTKLLKNHKNVRIVCVNKPCESHGKIVTNQLHVNICSYASHDVEDVLKFEDYPYLMETNVRIKDNMKSTFPTVKLTIHIPSKDLEGVATYGRLKFMINNHFMYRTLKLSYHKELSNEKIDNIMKNENFIELLNKYGSMLKENCGKCPACTNRCDLISPKMNLKAGMDAETDMKSIPKPNYGKFYHKATVEEFRIIDEYEEKLVQCYVHNIHRLPDE